MFNIWINSKNTSRSEDLMTFIVSYFNLQEHNEIIDKQIKLLISRFVSKINIRWTKCRRIKSAFLSTYSNWLDGNFTIPEKIVNKNINNKDNEDIRGRGRPRKPFTECGSKSRRKNC